MVERARSAVLVPVVPRRGIHQCLRKERGRVQVVRKACLQRSHGVGIRAIERGTLRLRIRGVPLRERLDERALLLRRARRDATRLSDRLPRVFRSILGDRCVDVRSERERDAPVTHRAPGIDGGRLAEGAYRLGVVERVGEPHPLIEISLGVGRRGRDGEVVAAEIVVEGSLRGSGGGRFWRGARAGAADSHCHKTRPDARRSIHRPSTSLPVELSPILASRIDRGGAASVGGAEPDGASACGDALPPCGRGSRAALRGCGLRRAGSRSGSAAVVEPAPSVSNTIQDAVPTGWSVRRFGTRTHARAN